VAGRFTGSNVTSLQRLTRFSVTAAIAAIPVITLCVFTALTIYAGNVAEFSVALPRLLQIYLPFALAIIVFLGLPGAFLNPNALSRYLTLLAALGVLTWLQGSILVWDYGALDGRSISWMSGAWRGVLDLGIWITVLAVASRKHELLRKTFIAAAVATFAIQAVNATTMVIGLSGELPVRSAAAPQNPDALFGFSAERNVVHIVMDGFQTDIFQGILAAEGGEAIKHELQGFTLFEQNLGVYPYTQLTVPALLTGELHRNEVPVNEFVTDTLQGQTVLGAAMDAGYEVDIASQVALVNAYGQARHTNVYAITPSDDDDDGMKALAESARLLDLALFRVVPHFIKALVHRDELWVFQARVSSEEYRHMQYFLDLSFLRQLSERMTADRDAPVYKMIHVMLAHQPTVGNARCEYDGRRPTNRDNVAEQASCGWDHVIAVLQRMKALGIYDNSLIVLMADHGAWVPVEGLRDASDEEGQVNATTVAMAIPVLAIKPPAAIGALKSSDVPTSIVDVPATIADILELPNSFPGKPAFDIEPGQQRERFHAVYGYGENDESPGFLFPMQEYRVTGDPYDVNSWQRMERHFPGGLAEAK